MQVVAANVEALLAGGNYARLMSSVVDALQVRSSTDCQHATTASTKAACRPQACMWLPWHPCNTASRQLLALQHFMASGRPADR
jgi:hypothetical protein